MFVFASNNEADFLAPVVSTNTAHFRASRVSKAFGCSGNRDGIANDIRHYNAPVAGSVTWMHAMVFHTNLDPLDSGSDGAYLCEAFDANGNQLFWFDALDGNLRLLVTGDTTGVDSTSGFPIGATLGPLDVKVDLSGGNLTVEAYANAADSSAPPILSATVANSGGKGNPVQWWWRHWDVNTGLADSEQYISEVMVADEDTRGLGLTDLLTFGVGTHSDWAGDPDSLSDEDSGTGVNAASVGDKVSRAIAGYTGPASTAVRGVLIPARGSKTEDVSDVRAFLRDAGGTDHAAAAGYGFANDEVGFGIADFALNPDTGLAWDTADLTDFEYGLEVT